MAGAKRRAAKTAAPTPKSRRLTKGQATTTRRTKAAPQEMAKDSDPQAWFVEYQDLDRTDGRNVIAPEGFERLCVALGFDMEGIEPIVLAWRLNSVELGTVEFAGWESALRELGVTDAAGLRRAVHATVDSFDTDPAQFKAFYRRVFDYLRVGNQKLVSAESIVAVLSTVARKAWVLEKFAAFLEANSDRVKGVNRDQWQSLLELSRDLKPDLSNYSKDDAWPALLDDFVDWIARSAEGAAAPGPASAAAVVA